MNKNSNNKGVFSASAEINKEVGQMDSIYASEQFCQVIWPDFISHFKNENTAREYGNTITEFLEFYKKDFLQIDSLDIALRYFQHMEDKVETQDIEPSTMSKKYRQIHSVAEYICKNREQYDVSESFQDYFSVYLSKLEPIALSNQSVPIEDIDKLLQAASDDTMAYCIMSMIYRVGLTSVEITELKLEHFIAYDNGVYAFVPGRKEPCFIPEDVYSILEGYLRERKENTYLFYNSRNTKLNKMYISRMMKKYSQRAGVKEYNANQLRNACGYAMTSYNVDAALVSRQLGVMPHLIERYKDKSYADASMRVANSLVKIKVEPPNR